MREGSWGPLDERGDPDPTFLSPSAARQTTLRKAREQREQSAVRYKPARIKLLLVAEGPPTSLERYFYFDEVREQDNLFRYVYRCITGHEPTRSEKASELAELRDRGVFLIDVSEEPLSAGADLSAFVPGLVSRCVALDAERIILIKATVFDAASQALQNAGLPVVNQRIPFPGSGRQREFERSFAAALNAAG